MTCQKCKKCASRHTMTTRTTTKKRMTGFGLHGRSEYNSELTEVKGKCLDCGHEWEGKE